MEEFIRFAFLGFGIGAVYALSSQALIVVYRGSGVLNFAMGAIGMAGVFVQWDLHVQNGWGYWPSVVAGVVFSALIGAVTHLGIMRPLRRSSPLVRVIATLGVLVTLQAIAVLRYGSTPRFVLSELPTDIIHISGTITITADRLILLGIAVGLTAVLWALYRYTTFGLATTAVAENERATNPCRVRGASTTKRARQVRPATLDELAAVVRAMPEQYRLLTLLAAWCALRFGELTELRRKDVDLANDVLHVRRGVARADGEVIVGMPKSDAGRRDVAIPPHLVPMLREHLGSSIAGGRERLLFPAVGDPTKHLAPATLYRPFYVARDAAGRPDLRWHDLRHTGAVLAASTGATLAELMARLGHSTPQAALRYQHAAAGRDRQIAAALSALANSQE